MTSSLNEETHEILVLYASQSGTVQAAAEEFCKEMPSKLNKIKVAPTLMTLDDFLTVRQAAWTPIVVIFVSSFGVGAAPAGGHRFRDLCEHCIDHPSGNKILTGLQYALCGLGNSSFRTYFENPSTIDEGLTIAGASRIGELGKADASGKGEFSQANVITKWKEGIWESLSEAIDRSSPRLLSEQALKSMIEETNALKY